MSPAQAPFVAPNATVHLTAMNGTFTTSEASVTAQEARVQLEATGLVGPLAIPGATSCLINH